MQWGWTRWTWRSVRRLQSLELMVLSSKLDKPILDYTRIIANTKFEQQEQLDLDGFPANNYIYCIEPATGDPDSFDVGTYGMIIFIFSANNRRSNGLVGRLKKDGKKYRWTQILQVSGQGSSIFKYREYILHASSPIFPCCCYLSQVRWVLTAAVMWWYIKVQLR